MVSARRASTPSVGRGVQRVDRAGGEQQRERGEAREQRAHVDGGLAPRAEPPVEPVGVEVAREERPLEEDEAGRPHRGRSAEPRQEPLRDDRLDAEEEERAQTDRRRRDGDVGPRSRAGVRRGVRVFRALLVERVRASTRPLPRGPSRTGRTDRSASGKNVVVFRSEATSRMVWRNRSCTAMGVWARTRAACESFSAAWNSASALMTLARRSRSASACFDIARCMSCGRSTCLTSTAVTFTPQGSVCWSMIRWSCWLTWSRDARRSSSSTWPSTLRSVVCAICDVA